MIKSNSKQDPPSSTLPPSFPVENEKDSAEVYIRRVVLPILEKFAVETTKNHMMAGFGMVKKDLYALYQPHNYRLYFDFSKTNFKPEIPNFKGMGGAWWGLGGGMGVATYKLINKTEHYFNDFMNCNIKVKKHTIEITSFIDHKKWYRINMFKASDEIKDIIIKKDIECIKVLKRFIKTYGGSSKFHIVNRRSEDKIKGEDFIDKLPIKMAFHNDVSKKVYNESNVEFKDPVYASNYLENQAVKLSSDEILSILKIVAEQNKEIAQGLNSVVKILQLNSPKVYDPDQDVVKDKPDYIG